MKAWVCVSCQRLCRRGRPTRAPNDSFTCVQCGHIEAMLIRLATGEVADIDARAAPPFAWIAGELPPTLPTVFGAGSVVAIVSPPTRSGSGAAPSTWPVVLKSS